MPNTTAVLMHAHYKYRRKKNPTHRNPASTVIEAPTQLLSQDIFRLPSSPTHTHILFGLFPTDHLRYA